MNCVVKRFGELTTDELYDLLQLRCAVFVVEQNCPYQDVDGIDRESTHLWLEEDGRMLAYLRWFRAPEDPGKLHIGRVLSAERGKGWGARVLKEALQRIDSESPAEIEIEAQVYARGFYEREGFVACSEEFDLDGIPHLRMVRPRKENE